MLLTATPARVEELGLETECAVEMIGVNKWFGGLSAQDINLR